MFLLVLFPCVWSTVVFVFQAAGLLGLSVLPGCQAPQETLHVTATLAIVKVDAAAFQIWNGGGRKKAHTSLCKGAGKEH